MPQTAQSELLGLDLQELTVLVRSSGQPAYRARQLFEALYRQQQTSIEQVTNLPSEFRRALATAYSLEFPRIEKKFTSVDGTIRYLIGLADGQSVEAVWMPEGDGGNAGETIGHDEESEGAPHLPDVGRCGSFSSDAQCAPLKPGFGLSGSVSGEQKTHNGEPRAENGERTFDRATICVSSQVGCAVDCRFCMTALLGLKRHLTPGEIVGQILVVLRDRQASPEAQRINLVFMGMGEPFLNYDNFMKAVRLLVEGVGIGESRMTVSTAGIVPRIRDFGREAVRPRLAISLNASNDQVRQQVMPINKKWNLEALIDAAREFPLRPRERLTFEYVLLKDVNDSTQNARELVKLLCGLRAKVNLIALNPGPDIPFTSPEEDRVLAFQKTLIDSGVPAYIRRPRGRDIYAACGQLKRTVS
jgi:23S rRNA (adenine2503-C2)-methyltransferase